MNSTQVAVLLPSYNERENLSTLLPALYAIQTINWIVVVDDHSPDQTQVMIQTLQREMENLHLVPRPGKLGYGTAILDGMRKALDLGAEIVVTLDADWSHDPAAIPDLINSLKAHHVVIGSRYVGGIRILNWSIRRLALSLLANRYVSFILSLHVQDATSGFRGYRREAIVYLLDHPPRSKGYAFLVECLFVLHKAGTRIGEVPIIYHERRVGKSKMSGHVIREAIWRPIGLYVHHLFRRSTHNPTWALDNPETDQAPNTRVRLESS